MKPWLTYTLLRLLLFVVPFGTMLALGMNWLYAVVIATLLAFAVSLLVLRKPREATAVSLFEAQQRRKSAAQALEESREDAHVDELHASEQQGSSEDA